MTERFIGLMSGTSLDGIDGVIAQFDGGAPQVLAHASQPFDGALRAELMALNRSGADELHRAALAANALARGYAQVVRRLLQGTGLQAADIRAIGAHGQTVRHQPGLHDGTGYTVQLSAPALLAELSGICVVADFRSRDVAAGGQGAPLAPFFHRAFFGQRDRSVGVLNLGGIANLTVLAPQASPSPLIGFDCGPANALMDLWCERHTGAALDADGAWAASGKVSDRLLASFMAEPFFAQHPPKSTGRDLFHATWLDGHLQAHTGLAPQDVQATLAELTARACAADLRREAPAASELVVCGGGALNGHLMRRLQAALPGVQVASSQQRGLPPLQVEAAAFAWLARQALHGEALDLKSTTGARGARVLGAVYPA
ncbi:MAG: anhydro-N-acetylmuramic acid kinase [Burkholderiaceae bacterium]